MTSLLITTMPFAAPSIYLWCLDDGMDITKWLQDHKPEQPAIFYLSFLNHCARAFDRRDWGVRKTSKYYKGHEQQTHEKLRAFPMHADTLIAMLAFYLANVWPKGIVRTGVVDVSNFRAPQAVMIEQAQASLYFKVFTVDERNQHARVLSNLGLTQKQAAPLLRVSNAQLKKKRQLEIRAAAAAANAAGPAPTIHQPGLAGQLPLPGGPPLQLPLREQPLAVASVEAALPVVDSVADAEQTQQQQQQQQPDAQHGAIVVRSRDREEES